MLLDHSAMPFHQLFPIGYDVVTFGYGKKDVGLHLGRESLPTWCNSQTWLRLGNERAV